MKTTTSVTERPSEVDDELQAAIRRAMSGIRDPQEMRKACERMDRMREEIRSREGILDVGVPVVRELRGELPEP